MTWPVTPNPGIHQLPPAIVARNAEMRVAQLRAAFGKLSQEILTELIDAIFKALGLTPFEGEFLAQLASIEAAMNQYLTTPIMQALGQVSLVAGQVAGLQTLAQTIATAIQSFIDAILQVFNPIAGANALISAVAPAVELSIGGLLAAAVIVGDGTATALANIVGNADGTATYLLTDASHSLLDFADGTAMSVEGFLKDSGNFLSSHGFSVNNWQNLLNQTGVANASQLVTAIGGIIPAALDNLDGTAAKIGSQITHNLDGTASYVQQQATTAINTLVDNADGTAMSLANAVNNAVAGAQSVGANITNGISGVWGSILGAFTGGFAPPAATPAQAYTAMQQASSTLSANTVQLGGTGGLNVSSVNQALQRSGVSTTGGSGGVNTAVNFTTYSNASAVTGFSVAAPPGYSADYQQSMGIQGGQVAWGYGPAGLAFATNPATEMAYMTTPTTTDYQVVSMVMNSANQINGNAFNWIIGRLNSAGTTAVWAQIGTGVAQIWCAVSGTLTQFAQVSHTAVMNATYELVLGDSTTSNLYSFKLFCNGSLVISYTDGGHVSQVGSSYRLAGFVMEAYSNFGGSYPATVSYWAYQDNAPPTAIGSGFRAYRTNTATITPSGGLAPDLVPSSAYDTTQYCTSDLTFNGSSNNKLTISIAGWYMARVGFTLSGSASSRAGVCLFKNGTAIEVGTILDPATTQITTMSDSFIVYCAANDYLQPGIYGGQPMTGEATGTQTYFAVSLMNCGTLS